MINFTDVIKVTSQVLFKFVKREIIWMCLT
jgi:hypothetical protein